MKALAKLEPKRFLRSKWGGTTRYTRPLRLLLIGASFFVGTSSELGYQLKL